MDAAWSETATATSASNHGSGEEEEGEEEEGEEEEGVVVIVATGAKEVFPIDEAVIVTELARPLPRLIEIARAGEGAKIDAASTRERSWDFFEGRFR